MPLGFQKTGLQLYAKPNPLNTGHSCVWATVSELCTQDHSWTEVSVIIIITNCDHWVHPWFEHQYLKHGKGFALCQFHIQQDPH